MDDLGSLTSGQNAALLFAFLQVDSTDLGYNQELLSIGKDFNLSWDAKCNEFRRTECVEDGDLECDGHLMSNITLSLDDIQPLAELPAARAEAAALQQIAEGLREIGAQIENAVVARALANLDSNISSSPSELWKHHLAAEVERAMRHGLGLDHLPQERVIMAFTLTLVKAMCERAPRLLRWLCGAALQYISPANANAR